MPHQQAMLAVMNPYFMRAAAARLTPQWTPGQGSQAFGASNPSSGYGLGQDAVPGLKE
jgi:hypothetical protein